MYGVTLSWMAGLPGPGPSDADAPAGARPAADEPPVTVLYSRRVKPGREADFQAWAHGIVAASRRFPGHLGASVLDAPGSREYHILFSFADRKSLRVWLDSVERRRWLARVGELIEVDQGLQQLTGLETWFKLPGSNVPTMKPPPRWKMWLISMVAVYPLVLLTLMTFVVMPVVTRLLRSWLGPRHDEQPVEGGLLGSLKNRGRNAE